MPSCHGTQAEEVATKLFILMEFQGAKSKNHEENFVEAAVEFIEVNLFAPPLVHPTYLHPALRLFSAGFSSVQVG